MLNQHVDLIQTGYCSCGHVDNSLKTQVTSCTYNNQNTTAKWLGWGGGWGGGGFDCLLSVILNGDWRLFIVPLTSCNLMGWSGGAKVLFILHHWGVQLILAYSWARPAILVVGKGRGGMFLFLLFLHFHSCSSFFPVPLFHLLYSLLSLFSLSLGDDTGVVGWCEGAVYLTSLGRPTDIGLQLGKACYPCSG